ncbi:hypothetical protein SAMN03097699_0562 [Flavobacteriaceae bacterium MAR_2010_188]|nr:hypothetical protein SAMN03097699_0562 [Flavobacteriaceae bacterium MAR_2010_188]
MGKQIHIAIMTMVLGMFLMPSGIFAHTGLSYKSEKNCHAINLNQSPSDCCNNHNNREAQHNDYNGTCGNPACHCPSSITFHINNPASTEVPKAVDLTTFTKLWNYTHQHPSPVYLQIWSPLQISSLTLLVALAM